MNPFEFFTRWKEGIKNLTPKRQLYSRLIGQIGLICGLSAAFVSMIIIRNWIYISIFGFIIFIQVIGIIGTRQQYIATLQMEKALGEQVPEEIIKPEENEEEKQNEVKENEKKEN